MIGNALNKMIKFYQQCQGFISYRTFLYAEIMDKKISPFVLLRKKEREPSNILIHTIERGICMTHFVNRIFFFSIKDKIRLL